MQTGLKTWLQIAEIQERCCSCPTGTRAGLHPGAVIPLGLHPIPVTMQRRRPVLHALAVPAPDSVGCTNSIWLHDVFIIGYNTVCYKEAVTNDELHLRRTGWYP